MIAVPAPRLAPRLQAAALALAALLAGPGAGEASVAVAGGSPSHVLATEQAPTGADPGPGGADRGLGERPGGGSEPGADRAGAAGEAGGPDAYRAFLEVLERFRRGDDAALAELDERARRLAEDLGREDLPLLVRRYAGLTAQERAAGRRAFDEYAALWRRVRAANVRFDRAGDGGAAWAGERDEILAALEELRDRSLDLADREPSARAATLAATIRVHHVETHPALSPAERDATLERARRDAELALALFDDLALVRPSLEAFYALGRIALAAGRLREAAERFEQCAARAEEVGDDDFRERALVGLVLVATAVGDARRADDLLAELSTFRSPKSCWPLAREHALRLLAEDQAEEAVRFLSSVLPGAGDDPGERLGWALVMGLARLRAGEPDAARGLLEEAARGGWDQAVLALARLALEEGRAAEALELARDPDRAARLGPNDLLFARAVAGEALLALGRDAEAERELAAAARLAARFEERLAGERLLGEATATVFGEALGVQAIALLAEARVRLGQAVEAVAAIESASARRLRRGRAPLDLGAQAIETWRAAYEHGLLTWAIGADRSIAIWLGPGGEWDARVLALGRREIARGVRRLRQALLDGRAESASALGADLARELVPAGLLAHLAGAPEAGGRLLVLAHGPLERLPLPALRVGDALFDERCTLLALPGLPAPAPGTPPARPLRWILAGAPAFAEGGPAPLPAAGEELAALAALRAETAVLSGASFTADRLERAFGEGEALHVATHLVRLRGRTRLGAVGLATSDGVLSAARIARARSVPAWIVLSACATADGPFLDAEGLQGLARAFLEAGSRDLVVTLWPVTDEAARAFALALHRELSGGRSPSHAARAARGALRRQALPAADWAAFAVLGRD